MSESFKHLLDGTAIGTALLAILQVVPHITAVLGLVWMCYRLYNEHQRGKLIKKELKDADERIDRLDS